ncbi:AraC family transcriptional regulator [Bifidobacterium scaligerum]|nr:AraC family transcriptional regulator [Bifidobacterium scaligerum]
MTAVYAIDLNRPLYYFMAGEFNSEPGWRHNRFIHDNDFEVIIPIQGHFELAVEDDRGERTVRISPGNCTVLPPRTKGVGAARTGEHVNFFWMHFVATSWRPGVITTQKGELIRPSRSGAAQVDVAESDEELDATQSGTIQASDVHSGDTSLKPTENEDFTSLIATTIDHISRNDYCPDANNLCLLPERFRIDDINRILLPLKNLLACANSYRYSQKENDYLTAVVLIELCDSWLRSLTAAHQEHTANTPGKTVPIVEWIRAYMSAQLTVASVAEHFQMNPDYLSRLFKQEQGVNLRDYLISLRVETAKVLLIRTDFSLARITRYSYFNDERNFIKQFKKATGLTPTNYRKQFAQTHLNNGAIDPTIPIPQELRRVIEGLYM